MTIEKIEYYYNLKFNRKNMLTIEDLNAFKFLFKTKKSFNDFRKSLVCKGGNFCKKYYYIDLLFEQLGRFIFNYISNDFKKELSWYCDGYAPNFNKQIILDIWDMDNNNFKFNNN